MLRDKNQEIEKTGIKIRFNKKFIFCFIMDLGSWLLILTQYNYESV